MSILTPLPTYEQIAVRPRQEEIRDAAGEIVGVSSTLDDLFECMLCGAAVRSQERHTEWHRTAGVRSMFGI